MGVTMKGYDMKLATTSATLIMNNEEVVTTEYAVNVIVKEGGKWYVKSEKGKNLGGPYDSKSEAEDRLKEVEKFKHMKKNQLVTMKSTVSSLSVRNDTMEDKDWLVVPMVMLVEGVHSGSCGALYYPKEELEKTPVTWNHKPVVVYHPNGPTACDPDVLTARKIGVIMNTKYEDGKLKAEAWLDPVRIKKVDERVAEAIENQTMMELSTGLFTDIDNIEGDWGDEHYDALASNYRPDHLALLPDMKGACSMEDGAGFLRLNSESIKPKVFPVISELWAETYFPILKAAGIDTDKLTANELSHSAVWGLLDEATRKKNSEAWVEEVFDSFLCYRVNGELFKQEYEIDKSGKVAFVGIAQPVVRVVEYKLKSEVTNDAGSIVKEQIMNKEELIAKLLENKDSGWTEKDKDVLNTMDETHLTKIVDIVDNKAKADAEAEKKIAEEAAKNAAVVVKDEKETSEALKLEDKVENEEKKGPMTEEEYIAAAPKNIQNVLNRGLKAYNSEKERLIGIIKANKNNAFKDEYLQGRDLDELGGLARLAAPEKSEDDVNSILMADYSGQAEAVTSNTADIEVLDLPAMSFDEK